MLEIGRRISVASNLERPARLADGKKDDSLTEGLVRSKGDAKRAHRHELATKWIDYIWSRHLQKNKHLYDASSLSRGLTVSVPLSAWSITITSATVMELVIVVGLVMTATMA